MGYPRGILLYPGGVKSDTDQCGGGQTRSSNVYPRVSIPTMSYRAPFGWVFLVSSFDHEKNCNHSLSDMLRNGLDARHGWLGLCRLAERRRTSGG